MCGIWVGNGSTHLLFSYISGHVKRKIAVHRFFSVSKYRCHVRRMVWKRFHASSVLTYSWSSQEQNRGSPIFFSLEIQMPCAANGLETVPRILSSHIFLVMSRGKSRFTDFFDRPRPANTALTGCLDARRVWDSSLRNPVGQRVEAERWNAEEARNDIREFVAEDPQFQFLFKKGRREVGHCPQHDQIPQALGAQGPKILQLIALFQEAINSLNFPPREVDFHDPPWQFRVPRSP